ncbi:hypothetical protein AURDEDRAFT_64606 [Auricularia subglabra TFB-10046 SS5]|nr:hypothetical protein AURDEDRAFT_64606 [Auricularia subglabra TFB-10046 SS5]
MSTTNNSSVPTRNIAGIPVADTPLVRAALAFARERMTTDWGYNHVVRSWLFASLIVAKLPREQFGAADLEVVSIAALLHDLGFELGDTELVSSDKRFEVDGANAARAFLAREAPDGWAGRKTQLVWDAIALHTIGSIVFHKEPEVAACAFGIWADFQGPDRTVPPGLLSWEEYDRVVKEFPRHGLMAGLKGVMCGLCKTKPETTYDNTVGDWGDMFVEGYDRAGKLTRDLLLTCDLDGRESRAT